MNDWQENQDVYRQSKEAASQIQHGPRGRFWPAKYRCLCGVTNCPRLNDSGVPVVVTGPELKMERASAIGPRWVVEIPVYATDLGRAYNVAERMLAHIPPNVIRELARDQVKVMQAQHGVPSRPFWPVADPQAPEAAEPRPGQHYGTPPVYVDADAEHRRTERYGHGPGHDPAHLRYDDRLAAAPGTARAVDGFLADPSNGHVRRRTLR